MVRVAVAQGYGVFSSRRIPWGSVEDSLCVIEQEATRFRGQIETRAGEATKWGVIWAAGKATTASGDDEIRRELTHFERAIEVLGRHLGQLTDGNFALVSSAGGVYGGSSGPPFTSQSEAVPLGNYGRLKLAQEELAAGLVGHGMRVLAARLSNVYGPGQDLDKLQGLISQLIVASIRRQPLRMFVPLDTLRDYISADDAAVRTLHWLHFARDPFSIKVIASGRPISLGSVIGVARAVTQAPIPVAFGFHASQHLQSADLRLIPDQDSRLRQRALTSLPVGIKQVQYDILTRYQLASPSVKF